MFSRAPILILLSPLFVALVAAPPAFAAKHKPHAPAAKAESAKDAGPKAIGTFDDWIAATHEEAGQPVCYAFTPARDSSPTIKNRGRVVMTVTQRPKLRDAVAMEAGFTYDPNATVIVHAEKQDLEFYTDKRNAFARDGHAAVELFKRAGRAVVTSPGPHGTKVTDTFSLKGFTAAYTAITKACPSR
jgi:Invasion associated locus B (IalB) protein